jgi:menaquinone-dependent protoporphyrinogen oxidase
MSTLIVYGTKYGCTELCAKKLAEKLNGDVHICNIKKEKPDLSKYDRVIIGSSMYIGKIRKEVKAFCEKNLEALKTKKLGLFTCGMQKETYMQELEANYPKELLDSAQAKDWFGGEFVFRKMNGIERMMVRKFVGVDNDMTDIKEDSISRFAQLMNA